MTDTTTATAIDYEAIEAEETRRVHDAITRFREAMEALEATEGAECSYQWEELLAVCVDGQLRLAEFYRGVTLFIGDMWPAEIGRAAAAAASQARQCGYAMAAVSGQTAHIPQVEQIALPAPQAVAPA
ncbi:hypothetical protein AB0B28_06440 [Glycomyces sp. NPDC046736]|uniref:hypothetical protein n=1 Tax=Glycomyces sp. NPDC046736 TaxID=3155615 RepID=UPI0033F6533B